MRPDQGAAEPGVTLSVTYGLSRPSDRARRIWAGHGWESRGQEIGIDRAMVIRLALGSVLADVLRVSMAVTILFGLAFGTSLTMVLLAVLYRVMYRSPSPGRQGA